MSAAETPEERRRRFERKKLKENLTVVGNDAPEIPSIDAGDMDLPRVSKQALDALVAANEPPRLFRYGGLLSRLESDEHAAPLLRPLTEDRTRYELARSAHYWKIDRKGNVQPALPPTHVVRDVLATPNLPLPILNRITEVPTFAPDGTLDETPGYQADTQTFYAPSCGFKIPRIPDHPTAQQVQNAKSFLVDEMLGGFPFVGPAEMAHAISLFLDPFVRNMIDGPTPLRVIDAPSPGSGKGLLAAVLLSPAIGREPSVMTAPKDEDEWRKRLFSALKTSPSSILIDNLTGYLSSGTLAGILTATYFEDRILGLSEVIRVPIRCAWVATSNNATMSTDHARRTVRIRLDPKVDKPWMRTGFAHADLRSWAHVHRVKLVWSGLVLVRHWINEGMPAGTKTLGSYERWAAVLGGILDTIEIPGFLDNLEELYETADSEGAVERDFVLAWLEKFSETEVGVGELFEIAGTVEGFDFGRGNDRAQRTNFGRRLVRMRDRIVEGYRVTYVRKVKNARKWRLRHADEVNPPAEEVNPSEAYQEDFDL